MRKKKKKENERRIEAKLGYCHLPKATRLRRDVARLTRARRFASRSPRPHEDGTAKGLKWWRWRELNPRAPDLCTPRLPV